MKKGLAYILILTLVAALGFLLFARKSISSEKLINSASPSPSASAAVLPSAPETATPAPTDTPAPETPETNSPSPEPTALAPASHDYSSLPYVLREKVPILMYHQVMDGGTNSLYLSVSDFKSHLEYFSNAGITPITMRQLIMHWTENYPLPEKPIVLTFDDGYRSMYTTVFPLLKEKGWPATFYAVSGWTDGDSVLTKEMLAEMAAAGMEIGSHSVSHVDLEKSPAAVSKEQIIESKKQLEEYTGKPILSICYPSGRYNENTIAMVKEAGYVSAVTTKYGFASLSQGQFSLFRVRISQGQGGVALKSMLAPLGY